MSPSSSSFLVLVRSKLGALNGHHSPTFSPFPEPSAIPAVAEVQFLLVDVGMIDSADGIGGFSHEFLRSGTALDRTSDFCKMGLSISQGPDSGAETYYQNIQRNILITENGGHKLEICKLLQLRETNLFVTKPSSQCISNDISNN